MDFISCEKCDGKLKESTNAVPFESRAIGTILVPSVHHYKCTKCNSRLISYEGAKTLLKYVADKEVEAISSLPIGDFISLNEAAKILEVTKQAFNKNLRIKRGFIYSTIICGRRVYYKKSVEEFKITGKDGRIRISSDKDVRMTSRPPIHTTPTPRPKQKIDYKNVVTAYSDPVIASSFSHTFRRRKYNSCLGSGI